MSREAAFIEQLRMLAGHPAARGLNDDVAVLELGENTLILTKDMLVEGTHFLPGTDLADVAWKLVATNLSDLAAKGAKPIGVMLGHMLSSDGGDEHFLLGLHDVLTYYNVPLLGGDTVSAPNSSSSTPAPLTYSLTAIGEATHTPVPSRSAAQIGDALYITGQLGAAMMGFEALKSGELQGAGKPHKADISAHLRPMARIAEGQAIAQLVHSMMDISDGLLLDAFKMAQASEVSIAIESKSVPIATPEERRFDALCWGDDYELLFTLPAGITPPIPATKIGQIEPQGFAPLFLDGEPVTNAEGLGYSH